MAKKNKKSSKTKVKKKKQKLGAKMPKSKQKKVKRKPDRSSSSNSKKLKPKQSASKKVRTKRHISKKKKSRPVPRAKKSVSEVDESIEMYKAALEEVKPTPPPSVSITPLEMKVEEEEKVLKKSFFQGSKLAPLSTYFFSTLICVAALAFMFGSIETFGFYLVFGIFLWWWAHQMHKGQHALAKTVPALGSIIIFLYAFYWIFDDLLSLFVCIIYALCFLIACILYFYHGKSEFSGEIHRSFSRTFLVILYSHIIAFTAASLVAYVLPWLVLGDSFVGMMFLLSVWFLPALLVYFFLTKFLYLRFFDRKHIKRDIQKGLAHSLVYVVVFIKIILLAYFLTAVQLIISEKQGYDDSFNRITAELESVKQDIGATPAFAGAPVLGELEVAKDVVMIADQTEEDAAALKQRIEVSSRRYSSYVSDSYFTELSSNRFEVSRVTIITEGISETKDDLIREYSRVNSQMMVNLFDDGTRSIGDHRDSLSGYLIDNYSPYREPTSFAILRQRTHDSFDSYSGLVEDGQLLEFNLGYRPEMSLLKPGRSRFSRQFYNVIYHTIIFRDLMVFVFNTITLNVEETIDPYAVGSLYHPVPEESLLSSVLRYRVVKANLDAALASGG